MNSCSNPASESGIYLATAKQSAAQRSWARLSLFIYLFFFLHLFAFPSFAGATLEKNFKTPPPSARPWVYWFWLNGNISSNGITADLEAMRRVGIGGVLIMEVDQDAPAGPVDFMSQRWRNLFKHVVAEARRLNLEVNLNNDAGWSGSGGPWIAPEQAMQKVVFAETNVTGPCRFEGMLPEPEVVAKFYRDICILAFPKVGSYRIPDIKTKAAYETGYTGPSDQTNPPPEMIVQRDRLVDLSTHINRAGRVAWDVPGGEWTLLRIGHTCTGKENAPAPKSGRGLDCDKLSREGIEANFAGMMAPLAADTGLKTRGGNFSRATKGLIATHIDSWEVGSQNWTPKMRQEFRQRRGYDLFPYLPVLSGRVVDSAEISARFLWDLRRTISELIVENYAAPMRDLAHEHGLRFTLEAYGGPCDSIPYAAQSDEPMGEFWSPSGAMETCKAMASAAHVYGKTIVGAEAFTAADQERWREYPGALKPLGDYAFCEGINRFVFHRYALQPWAQDVRPGMMMGPYGQHYERTQTWWEQTAAWHQYLARCQFMLRQGRFVADICFLQAETPPHGPGEHQVSGFDWDECSAEVVQRMSVRDGRLALPDGMDYRVLVLPDTTEMSPALLRKISDLVKDGATILGAPPRQSPSLSGYPECDREVQATAAALWGNCDGAKVKQFNYGKGRVVRSLEPEKVLRDMGVAPDFLSDVPLRHVHRQAVGTDIYFVANPARVAVTTTATFRVNGRAPELWWPDTGRIEPAGVFYSGNGLTRVVLPLASSGSVFVIFRTPIGARDNATWLSRNGKELVSALPHPVPIIIRKAVYGLTGDPQRSRDVGDEVQHRVDGGETHFPVRVLSEAGDPAPNQIKTLAVDYSIEDRSFTVKAQDPATIYLTRSALTVTVQKADYGVLTDPKRTRDVREKLQRLLDAGEASFTVSRMAEGDDPAVNVVKTLSAECEINGKKVCIKSTDPDVVDLEPPLPPFEPTAEVRSDAGGKAFLEIWQPGEYEVVSASSQTREYRVSIAPPSLEVTGSWRVRFQPKAGAPPEINLECLISWSEHTDPGVKYFSGTATYFKTLDIPRQMLVKNRRLFLDLGKVEVMAKVRLNGKDLGTLWTPPFALDITSVARPGANRLEVDVVNLWPNRLIGDEQLPEDSDRKSDGTLKNWPKWLSEGKPSPAGRFTFSMSRLWKKEDALLPSGLLGPVRLKTAEMVPLAKLKAQRGS